MTAPAAEMTIAGGFEPVLAMAGLAEYDAVMATGRGEALVKPGLGDRERIRLDLPGGPALFLKRYAESAPALSEWDAVAAVRAANVPTMRPVAVGAGADGGFVIVTAVPGEALSRCMDDLLDRRGDDPEVGSRLADRLGRLAGRLHAAGLAHRDFYTTHIFAHETNEGVELYLIDLARVFRPSRRRWRWWLKDLAQLRFSLPARWARRHWQAVHAAYEAQRGVKLPWWGRGVIAVRARHLTGRETRKAAAAGGGA